MPGKQCGVIVDANQLFNRNEALRRGRMYQQMGCFRYEDPLEMEGGANKMFAGGYPAPEEPGISSEVSARRSNDTR